MLETKTFWFSHLHNETEIIILWNQDFIDYKKERWNGRLQV